ncbi:MAG: hypothetical protein BRD29_04990, partial [Bacteroidetes bacterium QH_2_67_10]
MGGDVWTELTFKRPHLQTSTLTNLPTSIRVVFAFEVEGGLDEVVFDGSQFLPLGDVLAEGVFEGRVARDDGAALALGHIHQHQNRAPDGAGGPPVIYPSSIERVSFKEWDEKKGFVLVDIDADGAEEAGDKSTQHEFVETPARSFVALRVDAREAEDPTEAILEEIQEHDLSGAIVRVRYHIEEAQVTDGDTRRLR